MVSYIYAGITPKTGMWGLGQSCGRQAWTGYTCPSTDPSWSRTKVPSPIPFAIGVHHQFWQQGLVLTLLSPGRPGCRYWSAGCGAILFLETVLSVRAGLYAEALGRIFKQWDFDSILPCHGDYVAQAGKRVLQEHLELVGERKRLISP